MPAMTDIPDELDATAVLNELATVDEVGPIAVFTAPATLTAA